MAKKFEYHPGRLISIHGKRAFHIANDVDSDGRGGTTPAQLDRIAKRIAILLEMEAAGHLYNNEGCLLRVEPDDQA